MAPPAGPATARQLHMNEQTTAARRTEAEVTGEGIAPPAEGVATGSGFPSASDQHATSGGRGTPVRRAGAQIR